MPPAAFNGRKGACLLCPSFVPCHARFEMHAAVRLPISDTPLCREGRDERGMREVAGAIDDERAENERKLLLLSGRG